MTPLALARRVAETLTGVPAATPLPPVTVRAGMPVGFESTAVGVIATNCLKEKTDDQ